MDEVGAGGIFLAAYPSTDILRTTNYPLSISPTKSSTSKHVHLLFSLVYIYKQGRYICLEAGNIIWL